jgi:ABC-type uncharacterized transport system substrate-binding protein
MERVNSIDFRLSRPIWSAVKWPCSLQVAVPPGCSQQSRRPRQFFSIGSDPVEIGLVASLNRPGGNITGVYQFTAGLEAKRLGLLQEMVPKAGTVAVLLNPNYAPAENQLRDVQEAATRLGVQLVVVHANTEAEFNAAFSTIVQQKAGALLVCASPFFNSRRDLPPLLPPTS